MKLPLAIALLIAAQMPLAAAAFDEVEQTDQKRFKSMKTCAGCHLLQPRQSGPLKMIGANFLGADLRQLDLRSADLRRADLRGADLSRANLTKASLQGADLRGVTYCRTILPSGDMKASDCQLWNAEPVRNKDRPLQARSVPEKAKVAAPDKVEQRPSDGANFGSFLSRLFSFNLTPPAEPRENFN